MEHCEGVTCPMLFSRACCTFASFALFFVFSPSPSHSLNVPSQEDGIAMNMLSPAGFLFSLGVALRIIRGGFAHFAPVCSTWVWVSRHSTSRSYIHPLGRPGQQIVGEANIMVARVVLLTALLIGRGVWVTIEQPVSSLMRSRVSPSQQGTRPPLVPG